MHKLRFSKGRSKKASRFSLVSAAPDSSPATTSACSSTAEPWKAANKSCSSSSDIGICFGSHSLTQTLNDDLLASVLSFVSYAPYEHQFSSISTNYDHSHLYLAYLESVTKGHSLQNKHSPASFFSKQQKGDASKPRLLQESFGTLTHTLSLVCKKFCSICVSSDVLWSDAIERLAEYDPNGWKLALSSYEQGHEKVCPDICSDGCSKPNGKISSLVSRACLNFHKRPSAKSIHRHASLQMSSQGSQAH